MSENGSKIVFTNWFDIIVLIVLRLFWHCQTVFTKCVKYYTKCDRWLLETTSGITTCDSHYKLRRNKCQKIIDYELGKPEYLFKYHLDDSKDHQAFNNLINRNETRIQVEQKSWVSQIGKITFSKQCI